MEKKIQERPVENLKINKPLFREEAVEHFNSQHQTTIVLERTVSHIFLTGLFLSIAVAIILFIIFFSVTKKTQTQGILLPKNGLTRVVTTLPGVVQQQHVNEGKFVRKGELLFTLINERSTDTNISAEKTVANLLTDRSESLRSEMGTSRLQLEQRVKELRGRADNIRSEIQNYDRQIALQTNRLSLNEASYERYKNLQSTNYISVAQLQEKQAEFIEHQHRLVELQRVKVTSERDLSSILAEIENTRLEEVRQLEILRRDAMSVQQDITENDARRVIRVLAPQDGFVSTINAQNSQSLPSNFLLATILPANVQLEAELYLPSRSIGFVEPGTAVLLRYHAFPYQKFGQHSAIVREVANTALRQDDISLQGSLRPTSATNEPLYRVRLTIDKQYVTAYGRKITLKSGMLLDASLILEKRRLYEWILEPLFSISGRL